MINKIRKNIMGTISFDAVFPGMRKAQDFIVYPMKDDASRATIQSDTRIGLIDMSTGKVLLSKPISSGAYFHHLATAKLVCTLSGEDLLILKTHIAGSAGDHVGSSVCHTDNSAAINVLSA